MRWAAPAPRPSGGVPGPETTTLPLLRDIDRRRRDRLDCVGADPFPYELLLRTERVIQRRRVDHVQRDSLARLDCVADCGTVEESQRRRVGVRAQDVYPINRTRAH